MERNKPYGNCIEQVKQEAVCMRQYLRAPNGVVDHNQPLQQQGLHRKSRSGLTMAQRAYNFHKCIIRYLCGWVQISDDIRDAGLVELIWQRYDVNKLVQGRFRQPILKGLACYSFNCRIDFDSSLFRRYLSSYNSQLVHVTRRGS